MTITAGEAGRRPLLWRLLLAACLMAVMDGPASGHEILPVLARVGPWPVASSLIGYDGRVWLVNSVKGVNHNSADVHSYDPATGGLRYERHLFSQDAGRPLVYGGLLYWPFEDSRFSNGWGEFMVTDGERWSQGVIPTAQIFHTHALATIDGDLVAATSAWRAGLQLSGDGGRTWREAYDHPTPARRVSRITDLAAAEGYAVGRLRAPEGERVLRFDGRAVTALPDWPQNAPTYALSALGGMVHGLVGSDSGVAVWRSDGARSRELTPPRKGWRVRALASGPDGLWVASAVDSGGLLWHSPDGGEWQVRYRLEGGEPREILLYGGRPYVAGAGADGLGILWGPAPPAPIEPRPDTHASWPGRMPRSSNSIDWPDIAERLDRVLADPASYRGHADALRDQVYRAAAAGPPDGLFEERLDGPFPDLRLSMIGGNTMPTAAQLGRWTLLWGMALSGRGHVPPALIETPWAEPPNGAEKYFATAPAAIWTAAAIGQADRATLAALVGRLDRPRDPAWLKGGVVGALNALTGKRFGYDTAAWRGWWAEVSGGWPD